MSREMYVQWQDNPTTTTVNTTAYPIKNVEFPAITICSQGSAKDILDRAMMKQFERYLKSKGKTNQKTNPQGRRKRSVVDSLSKDEVDIIRICTCNTYLSLLILSIRLHI